MLGKNKNRKKIIMPKFVILGPFFKKFSNITFLFIQKKCNNF